MRGNNPYLYVYMMMVFLFSWLTTDLVSPDSDVLLHLQLFVADVLQLDYDQVLTM